MDLRMGCIDCLHNGTCKICVSGCQEKNGNPLEAVELESIDLKAKSDNDTSESTKSGGDTAQTKNAIESLSLTDEPVKPSQVENAMGGSLPTRVEVPSQPKSPSLLQRRCLLWLWNFVYVGFKHPLEEEHLPQLIPKLRANVMSARAEELWSAEMRKKTSKWSLTRILWKMFRGDVFIGVLCNLMHGLTVGVAKPLMLRRVISTVEDLAFQDVALLGFVLLFEATVQLWMKQTMADEIIPGVFAACTSLLAKRMPYVAKGVVASPAHCAGKESDKTQNSEPCVPEPALIAQDLVRTLENSMMLYLIPSASVQLVCACVMLILFLGIPALIGIVYCGVVVYVSSQLAKVAKMVDKKGLNAADVRVSTLRQILDGIRFIKLAAWEDSYLAEMGELRGRESRHYRRFNSFQMLGAAIGRTTPPVAAMLTFVLLAILGKSMKPADIFAALSILMSLRLPLGVLPNSFIVLNSIILSLQRINTTLSQPLATTPALPEDEALATCMKDVEFQWSAEGAPTLHNVSFTVAWGQMVAVVGAVASGKSTLLTGILGGLPAARGSATLSSDAVAYIPQRPVVFSGTVLMNITMGNPFDDKLLAGVLEAAQFSRDLELMPHGLATEIGERGTTLSGGQQTRLNIARAFYHQPNLIVADDPLAAVDVHVASALFASLQRWKRCDDNKPSGRPHRALVMATNQLHLVPQFDHVIYLEESTIGAQGSPAAIEAAAKSNPNLARLLESARVAMSVDEVAQDISANTAQNVDVKQDAGCQPSHDANQGQLSKVDMTPTQDKQTINQEENRVFGALKQSIWLQYLRAVSAPWVAAYIVCLILAYGLLAANDWWLAHWMQKTQDGRNDDTIDCSIYAILAVGHSAMMFTLSFVSGFAGAHASRHLHKLCLSHILRAPMSWYEETPSGRTISRMSSDLVCVDLKLPTMFDHFAQMCVMMLVIFGTICVMVPWVLLPLVVLIPVYAFLDIAVNRSSRETKRITNAAMSPILTLTQEAANSRLLLRVTGQGPWLLNRTMTCVDTYNGSYFASHSLMAFLRFVGTVLGASISFVLCVLLWAIPSLSQMTPVAPTTLGLALAYSFLIPYFLSFVSLFWSMLRLFMASLERLMELQSEELVPQERAKCLASDPSASWPLKGKIEFKAATMCYRPGLPAAVKDLTLVVAGGERLGIVGRTGAGKSSLSILLLRIVELSGGSVLIDDVNVSQIGLQALRQAVAVVPQDPFLFKGTVAENLDRFNRLPRAALAAALKSVDLSLTLEDDVGAGGEQLSSGERQLVAIARATLSSARIVVMDEPTASCDAQTDTHLQELIRVAFNERTVLCIAHRLNTIMSYDRVLVMEAGSAVELGTPEALMSDGSTRFAHMVAGMQSASVETSPGQA